MRGWGGEDVKGWCEGLPVRCSRMVRHRPLSISSAQANRGKTTQGQPPLMLRYSCPRAAAPTPSTPHLLCCCCGGGRLLAPLLLQAVEKGAQLLQQVGLGTGHTGSLGGASGIKQSAIQVGGE